MANTNVVTAENSAVKAKISEVTTAVSKSVTELGSLFIALCERFTGKDSQSGDNFQHLLNGLEGSKGAKRFQAAIIARLNDFSDNTISIDYDDKKQSYIVQTLKGDDKKSLFKKDKFIAAVEAAKSAEFSLNPPKKPEGEKSTKPRRFNPVKAQAKVAATLEDYAVKLMEAENLTPEILAVRLKSLVDEIALKVKPAIEGEKA